MGEIISDILILVLGAVPLNSEGEILETLDDIYLLNSE